MPSIRTEKEALRRAIFAWAQGPNGSEAKERFAKIEDAILALDNAAYDRAYKQRHEQCSAECHSSLTESLAKTREQLGTTRKDRDYRKHCAGDWHQTAIDRANEIDALRRDLSVAESQRGRWKENAVALTKERNAVRVELADARETICKWADADINEAYRRADRAHNESHEEADRLRKALETLTDRYHAQCCYSPPYRKSHSHSRQGCVEPLLAVKDAEKALTGESETPRFPGKIDNVVLVNRALTADDVKSLARELAGLGSALASDIGDLDGRVRSLEGKEGTGRTAVGHKLDEAAARLIVAQDRELFDDRKPKGQPEIEAVLMGNEIVCACGCGVTVPAGRCAYRFVKHVLAVPPLYASKECARRAAQTPRVRSTSPYAAYTRFLRRAEEEERHLRKPPEARVITDIDVLRACRGFHERGDFAPFTTLGRDFPATVITAKMQAMVARGLLKYDTSLSTARATRKGRRMLEEAYFAGAL